MRIFNFLNSVSVNDIKSMVAMAKRSNSIYEFLPIFDANTKIFEYEQNRDGSKMRKILETVRTSIKSHLWSKMEDKTFEGS